MLETLLYKDRICRFSSFLVKGGGEGTGGLEDGHLRRTKTCITLYNLTTDTLAFLSNLLQVTEQGLEQLV